VVALSAIGLTKLSMWSEQQGKYDTVFKSDQVLQLGTLPVLTHGVVYKVRTTGRYMRYQSLVHPQNGITGLSRATQRG